MAEAETGWGEPSETVASLDLRDGGWESAAPSTSPTRGRGRGNSSFRGGPANGASRGRGNGPRASPGQANQGPSRSPQTSPKASLKQNRSSQTVSSQQADVSSQKGLGDETTSTSVAKGTSAVAEQAKEAAKPVPVEATKVEVGLIDPGTEPINTDFAGKQTGWGDEPANNTTSEQQAQKAAEPVPVETTKAEISQVDPGKEPVNMDFSGKETGWATSETATTVDNGLQTPSLDPTVSAFEPKKQTAPQPQNGEAEQSQQQQDKRDRKPRGEGYVNPDRVDTGGLRKAKLSPEDLAAKMAKARERNAELLKKREVVDADEADWRDQEAETQKALEEERAARAAKAARLKEVQNSVDEARARNAARKIEKQSNRDWDSEKKQEDFDPAKGGAAVQRSDDTEEYDYSQHMHDGQRGRGRGRGRGGRGRGGSDRPPPIARNPIDLGDPNQFPSMFK